MAPVYPSSKSVPETQYHELKSHFQTRKKPFLALQNLPELTERPALEQVHQLHLVFADLAKQAGKSTPPLSVIQAMQQSVQLCASIFKAQDELQGILERYELPLREAWYRKNAKQRVELLNNAWPDMPTEHRPDFKVLYDNWDISSTENSAYLLPHINLEDLICGRNLPLLLNSRGRNHPGLFASSDLRSCQLGIATFQIAKPHLCGNTTFHKNTEIKVDGYTMILRWERCHNVWENCPWGESEKRLSFRCWSWSFSISDTERNIAILDSIQASTYAWNWPA